MRFAVLAALLVLPLAGGALEEAIRRNDLRAIRKLAAQSAAAKSKSTPLHYAAAFGTAGAVSILAASGADVNAQDLAGATPLFYAATSPEKTRILLKVGADPKIATRMLRTPLHIAAAQRNGVDTVNMLLAAGADVNAESDRGTTPLMDAATYAPLQIVKLLLARGADARRRDKSGTDALWASTNSGDPERLRILLGAGGDPNASNTFAGTVRKGPIALTNLTPLLLAATHGPAESVRTLLDAGAKVNVKDGRGVTIFDAAQGSDADNRLILEMLSKAGASGSAAPAHPEQAIRQRTSPAKATAAMNAALGRLAASGTEFFKESGCLGCHHQAITSLAFRRAGRRDSVAAEEMRRGLLAARALEPLLMQMVDPGGDIDGVSWFLIGSGAASVPSNSLLDAGVRYVLSRQRADGSWQSHGIARPPFEEGTIRRTALAVTALKAYCWPAVEPEVKSAIARARSWLLEAQPRHTYERAALLEGLHVAGVESHRLQRIASALIAEQRADGGWAQTSRHTSDAFATGFTLYALHEAGVLRPSDPVYRRGAEWLLRNQLEDGTWYVRSRSPKFQPYFESGFPHGHDQWISAPATAYAAMALAPLAEADARETVARTAAPRKR